MMTLGPTALRVSRTRDMRVSWRLGAAGGCCRSGAWQNYFLEDEVGERWVRGSGSFMPSLEILSKGRV